VAATFCLGPNLPTHQARACRKSTSMPSSCVSCMSTQMLWQMILHSTSLTMATGVLLRVKRRRRVDHPLGCGDAAPRLEARSVASEGLAQRACLRGSGMGADRHRVECRSSRGARQVFEETHWGIDMNLSLDAGRERSLGWSGSDHACGSN
jgi:hypothetical protein